MDRIRLNDDNETVIWQGRKNVPTSILDALGNRLVIPAVLIFLIDGLIFTGILLKTGPKSGVLWLRRTMWLHYIPAALYLIGLAVSLFRSLTTDYIVTNKYVYIQSGLLKRTVIANDIDDIEYVSVRKDVFDRWTHTGDITVFTKDEVEKNGVTAEEERYLTFRNIRHYEKVYALIEKIRTRECAMTDPEFVKSLQE